MKYVSYLFSSMCVALLFSACNEDPELFKLESYPDEMHIRSSVEEVVLLMWEFRQFAQENRVFFQYDWDNGLFFTDETPFRSLLVSIIRKGLRSYHIREDIDATAYANFFYANLSLYVLSGHTQSVILRYVLMPLLNERGTSMALRMVLSVVLMTG